MVKDDYIMRMIHEMVRAVLILLLGKDTGSKEEIVLPETTQDQEFQQLIHLVHEGRINEAENHLWDLLDKGQISYFQMALLFYDYLNGLDDDVLEAADFSQEEVSDGLIRVMKLYGYGDMVSTFLL